MRATRLSVNLNKIALLRNARAGDLPSLPGFATSCLDGGCDGVTVHPRPDQRHVRAADLADLRALVSARCEQADDSGATTAPPQFRAELNMEGNPFAEALDAPREDVGRYPGFMALALEVRPDQCTLVPDAANQRTSDHGFDLNVHAKRLAPIIDSLREAGIRASIFIDPDPEQATRAADIGAERIELYTGPYALRHSEGRDLGALLERYQLTAAAAMERGLGVNAGHGLNLDNTRRFIDSVPGVAEVSIGHALTADALRMGMPAAVRAYLDCLDPEAERIAQEGR